MAHETHFIAHHGPDAGNMHSRNEHLLESLTLQRDDMMDTLGLALDLRNRDAHAASSPYTVDHAVVRCMVKVIEDRQNALHVLIQ